MNTWDTKRSWNRHRHHRRLTREKKQKKAKNRKTQEKLLTARPSSRDWVGFVRFCVAYLVCVLFCIERSATQPVSPQMFHASRKRERGRMDSGRSGVLQETSSTRLQHDWVRYAPNTRVSISFFIFLFLLFLPTHIIHANLYIFICVYLFISTHIYVYININKCLY